MGVDMGTDIGIDIVEPSTNPTQHKAKQAPETLNEASCSTCLGLGGVWLEAVLGTMIYPQDPYPAPSHHVCRFLIKSIKGVTIRTYTMMVMVVTGKL